MSFGENLQCLRQISKMTQEELAERLSVSRQTISKWEMDNAYPEIPKLIEISNIFQCKIDELLNENIAQRQEAYSEIQVKFVDGFRMARYVMITPNPEDDVNEYMDKWAKNSGLLDIPQYQAKKIGWDFPFVSSEQQNRFGLRGYAVAYILPEGFEPKCKGAEITKQEGAYYASITIKEPFRQPFVLIPRAYKMVMEYLNANGFKEKFTDASLPCYEYEYVKDGVCYMEVNIQADAVGKENKF